ncbi:hypothetical protein BGZ47_006327 [Haplosporangium gracile]|nr:hypothetical protein BGZ47_006327 [Haplosporangium gracile]
MEFIVTWLEHVPNFISVFGSGGQTAVGQPNKSRNHGYAALADAVSKQSKGRLNINGKNMRERFKRHIKVFTSTKAKGNSAGFGVTDEDTRNGIYTVTHKLESMCTCYARMDALFGLRLNVTPLAELCLADTPAQEQDERQDSGTAPQRRRRLVEEEEEEEEEEEVGDYIANQDYGGLEDGNSGNTYTQDDSADIRPVDNTFDDNVDNNFDNDGTDSQDGFARDINAIDGDEISILSTVSPVIQRQSKRQLTDTESQTSHKPGDGETGVGEKETGAGGGKGEETTRAGGGKGGKGDEKAGAGGN